MRRCVTLMVVFMFLFAVGGIFISGCSTGTSDVENTDILGISGVEPAGLYRFERVWGGQGSDAGQLFMPWGVYADSQFVYVADYGNRRVQKFDHNGNYVSHWTNQRSESEGFVGVAAITGDAMGYIYAVDSRSVWKFDSNGTFIAELASYQVVSPMGLAVDSDRNIQMTEMGQCLVQKINQSGQIIGSWGSEGSGNGQLRNPFGISSGPDGNIFVADTGNHRIQKFDKEGRYLVQWGSQGTGSGQFHSPIDIDVHSSGLVAVADMANIRIQVFNSSGQLVSIFGAQGAGDGDFKSPRAVCFNPRGDIFVADWDSHKIYKFVRN